MSFENDEGEDDLTLPGISEGEIIVIRSARRSETSRLIAKAGE